MVDIARRQKHEAVMLEHVVMTCLKSDDVIEALEKLDVDAEDVEDDLINYFKSGYIPQVQNANPPLSTTVNEVLSRAAHSAKSQSRAVTGLDILVKVFGYTAEDSFAVEVLTKNGLTGFKLSNYMGEASGEDPALANGNHGGGAFQITNADEARIFLAKYCENLNDRAKESKIDPLIGREDEVALIVQITARRTKNNAILVGEPGVGKTAIAEGLAKQIVEGNVPAILANAEVWSLDVGALMAGTKYRGEMEERLKQTIKAFEFIDESIVFIDEIHTIMGAGGGGSALDIANLLKPALSKGTLRCIGSTTFEEFRKHFEKDRALLRRFKRVDVNEPSLETTKLILAGLKFKYEEFHGVTYTDEAIDAAADLTYRYINNALLPDKAIDIMDAAGAAQKVRGEEGLKVITLGEIETEVAKVARIPLKTIAEDETDKLTHLETDLQKSVFGQDKALTALCDAVFVTRAGLRDTNKPSGSFLFAGPTGVGKTEATRQLADTLGVPLIKYDMSEFMEKHTISKLIGSPPGYVGYEDGGAGSGKLVNDIETHPYCVLLLDEIEKAHPDIYSIFLQVMDDGVLTSSSGKKVDFRNVIIVMTTNAGAFEQSRNTIGFGVQTGGDPMEAIKRLFTPEFLNRLDAIVGFNRLSQEHILKVVDKFLLKLAEQAGERGVTIDVGPEARTWLAKHGFDDKMGARPLNRSIHDHIKTPLSRQMTIGDLKFGGTATVTVDGDKLVITSVAAPAKPVIVPVIEAEEEKSAVSV